MEQAIERATIHGVRTITLPPIGTPLPHLGGVLSAIQRGKPETNGIRQLDYAIIVPHGDEFEQACEWGGYDHDVPAAACMWDGFNNTAHLLADSVEHAAAKFCAGIEIAGHRDFYLPSLRELKALFANGCEAFNPDHWYWSSTQFSRHFAYFQYFGNGYTDDGGKGWKGGRARPVRRSSLESLIT